MKKSTKAIIGSLAGLALAIGTSVPASAHTGINYYAVNKSKTANSINFAQLLASCSVGTSGATCTISKGKTATRTISLSLGASRGVIASQLGISADTSVSVSTSCTSPVMSAGQVWKAYPVGDRWSYRIHKRTTVYNNQGFVQSTTNEYSAYLSAFNPYSASIHCRL